MLSIIIGRCVNLFKFSRDPLSRCLRGKFPSSNDRIEAKVGGMPSRTAGNRVFGTRDLSSN